MQPMLDHVSQNVVAYGVTSACVLAVVYVTRRQTLPYIMQLVEWVAYAVTVHFFVGGIVRFFAWFKDASALKNAGLEEALAQAVYTTPLFDRFWDRSLYEPEWIFFLELALILAAWIVAWKYRPVTWNKNYYKGKPGAPGAKAAASKLNQSRPQYNRERGTGGNPRR